MKRKYILVAAALAVLCAGMTACGTSQNTETSSSAPNSSSEPSSIASSEPESGSTSVTDNRDIAKAENFVTYQVFKEETANGTGAGTADQTMPTEDLSPIEDEEKIQMIMNDLGLSREEAETALKDVQDRNEEALKQKEEEKAAEKAAYEAFEAKRNQACLDATGMTYDEFLKLSNTEVFNWLSEHPDVDQSFLYMQP